MTEGIEKQITIPVGEGSCVIHYTEWGDPANPEVLFCGHGFTRNCHDYDRLAASMQKHYRVICIDFPGRGKSGQLPAEAYAFPTYVTVAMSFLGALGLKRVDWVGASMSGIVGLLLASNPATSPIRKLVLNDVGPVFRREETIRIVEYTGNGERFNDLLEAENYFRKLFAEWGKLPDEEWAHIARHSTQQLPDGKYRLAYDDNIVAVAKNNIEIVKGLEVWNLFEAIQCPILVLHGETSTLLPKDDVEQMKQRGKNVQAIDFPGIGHIPPLRSPDQIELVESWLLKDGAA